MVEVRSDTFDMFSQNYNCAHNASIHFILVDERKGKIVSMNDVNIADIFMR